MIREKEVGSFPAVDEQGRTHWIVKYARSVPAADSLDDDDADAGSILRHRESGYVVHKLEDGKYQVDFPDQPLTLTSDAPNRV